MNVLFTYQIMVYARAVWVEHGKEVEGTALDNWIDPEKKIIRWPKKGKRQLSSINTPLRMTFTLVKRKMTSSKVCKLSNNVHSSVKIKKIR